jgi:hypothetical protein
LFHQSVSFIYQFFFTADFLFDIFPISFLFCFSKKADEKRRKEAQQGKKFLKEQQTILKDIETEKGCLLFKLCSHHPHK